MCLSRSWGSLVVNLLLLSSLGCGLIDHDMSTDFGAPTHPMADSGANWDVPFDPNSPEPEEEPSHKQEQKPAKLSYRNTHYCKVDSEGRPTSPDRVRVTDGKNIEGVGGGCVERPIREVWGVLLNHPIMKPEDVNEYHPTQVFDLQNPSNGLYYVFNIENIVRRFPAITISWTTQWRHRIEHGTYELPNQIVVRLKKIRGSSHVYHDEEEYTLDRTTPDVTSFVLTQSIRATQVDVNRVQRNIREALQRARTAPAVRLPDLPS